MGSSRARLLAVVVACGVTMISVTTAPAHGQSDEPMPDPAVAALALAVDESGEPLGLSGTDAVDALRDADLLESVAVEHDLEPEELQTMLVADSTLVVTADASLAYVEVLPADAVASLELAGTLTLPPGTDVTRLESRPASPRVLYLDFDGHVTQGDPYWNAALGHPSIVSAAYGGTPEQKYEIWQRVVEDFAPFDVNVTTKDPGVDGLRRTSTSDAAYGQRMVISPTNWTEDVSTLGIALVGVFDHSLDRPAFVFTAGLSGPANIAEAVAHEAGHTFGLRHDAVNSQDYYDGHGRWAPIMGRPLDKGVTQWSKGEYAGATNREDDVAKIAACTRSVQDDAPNLGSAGLPVMLHEAVRGLIGMAGDTDVRSFQIGAGSLDVTLRPLGPGSNLRVRVTVKNASGGVIASGDSTPPAHQSATWDVALALASVPAGQYSVEIAPLGWENANTGFTAYGSMGQYTLEVSATPPADASGTGTATAFARAERLRLQPQC